MKNFIKNYWKTALVTAIICYFCFVPLKAFGEMHPPLFANFDKLVHFFMFFVLALVIFLEYKPDNFARPRLAKILFCWCFPVLFGLAIEGVQHFFLPPRTGDLRDWLFDCIGYIHGIVFMKMFFKIKARTNGTQN
ncbi:MAG: VanZ family protein [Prevotellaceae bacterium]|nr:VanZ family protein [Prevotellaceae bacterium]